MSCSRRVTHTIKAAHLRVQNGQLVRAKTPDRSQPNYRYIPYHPLTKPVYEDYFRATIDELIRQNATLKQQLDNAEHKPSEKQRRLTESTYCSEVDRVQQELEQIRQKYALSQAELNQQKTLASLRENQCKKLREENFKLHDSINQLVGELDHLKNKLAYTEQEAQRINCLLDKYNETMERVALAERIITENAELSEALSRSQRVIEYDGARNQDPDQFYTVRTHSHYGDDNHDRFMTPRQVKEIEEEDLYRNRTAQQNKLTMSGIVSINSEEIRQDRLRNSEQGTYSDQNKSNYGSQLSQNLRKMHEWATPNSKFSTIDMLEEFNDPVAGSLSFSGFFGH